MVIIINITFLALRQFGLHDALTLFRCLIIRYTHLYYLVFYLQLRHFRNPVLINKDIVLLLVVLMPLTLLLTLFMIASLMNALSSAAHA